MKKLFFLVSLFAIVGCSQQSKVPDYKVEFLSKMENKPILDKLNQDCLSMKMTGEKGKDSLATPENCNNAMLATKQFHKQFNSNTNTKRRTNSRTFSPK